MDVGGVDSEIRVKKNVTIVLARGWQNPEITLGYSWRAFIDIESGRYFNGWRWNCGECWAGLDPVSVNNNFLEKQQCNVYTKNELN